MDIDLNRIKQTYGDTYRRRGVSDDHLERRSRPSVFDFDYLILDALRRDLDRVLKSLTIPGAARPALDVGSARSPYGAQLRAAGYAPRTLDIDPCAGADYVGSVEATGLPEQSFDLVLCTQVLEHVRRPAEALQEIRRLLTPGGHLILAVPHVWPYHPCPADYWRFTQEGVLELAATAGLDVVRLLGSGGCGVTLFQTVNLLVYGALGVCGAPLFPLFNAAGRLVDAVVHTPLFCMNFTCLARRPANATVIPEDPACRPRRADMAPPAASPAH
jgi:SAM-dependent methyltransferase